MPVILDTIKEKGWDNNAEHAASDPILCATFTDEKTGRLLFKYAPKISDLRFWIELFSELGRMETQKIKNSQVCQDSSMAKTSGYDTGGK